MSELSLAFNDQYQSVAEAFKPSDCALTVAVKLQPRSIEVRCSWCKLESWAFEPVKGRFTRQDYKVHSEGVEWRRKPAFRRVVGECSLSKV